MPCTLIDNEYASLLFSQTFFCIVVLFLYVERFCKSFWKESLTRTSSSFAYCSACTFNFNCQQILAKISFFIFDIVIKKTIGSWFSVALVKFHWFGINWHVFNQSGRNCCLYFIIEKIAPQAKSGKYFQIWFFPRFGGKNGGVLSMRM